MYYICTYTPTHMHIGRYTYTYLKLMLRDQITTLCQQTKQTKQKKGFGVLKIQK